MNAGRERFLPQNETEVARLIREYPLAWVVTPHAGNCEATLLPLRPLHDAQGRLIELRGHFSRSNSQVDIVRRNPRALMLFLGPHGYISPSWLTDRTQAPTWNYASAQFLVHIELIEDSTRMDGLMRDLVDAAEAGRKHAWSIDDMGSRYQLLVRRVIGFHARILEVRAKFKLGQDEHDDNYAEIMRALADGEDKELRVWMARNNPAR